MGVDLSQICAELGLPFFALLALLGVALLFSAYLKVMTVLGILRLGLGGGALPSQLVTGAIALSLTFFIMYPVLQRSALSASTVLKESSAPRGDEIRYRAIDAAATEWSGFLKQHSEEKLVSRFTEIANKLDAKNAQGVQGQEGMGNLNDSWRVLAPAFVISQMKEAFSIGLRIILPFLIVDLLVVVILGSLGLERLDPSYVALPAKLALFTMVDGWTLVTSNLVMHY